jgi:hypothetical protein
LVLTVAAVGSVAALETDFHVVAARFSSLDPSAEENVPDLTIRVTKTYDQIGSLLDTEPSWWVGHGTGTASPYLWHLGVSRTVEEAFFSEVLYQLGVLGPIAYLAMFGTILAEGIRSLRASPEVSEAVWKRVFFVYVAQVIAMTLLTGDEGLVYFPSNVFFWLFLGGLLAQPAPHREPALANI